MAENPAEGNLLSLRSHLNNENLIIGLFRQTGFSLNASMETLLQQVTSLRRSLTEFGPAPHKPIMLLALLESFDEGEIESNWIGINDALLTRFYDLWNLHVMNEGAPNFSLAFYHLSNEKRGLWELIATPGKRIITSHKFTYKSLKVLKETFLGAKLSARFYSAITNRLNRNALKHALLNTYFPNRFVGKSETPVRYSEEIGKQILYDLKERHTGNITRPDQEETIESKEEINVLRKYIFRKTVLEIYNNQCAMSGLKINSPEEELLIDACHIIPFSQSCDDTIQNGIALSPTLHRAFDSGLIAIDDNYKILVHQKLKNYKPSAGIHQYENTTILLPESKWFYPSQQRLAEHRVKFGY